jgi:hypothetical protein
MIEELKHTVALLLEDARRLQELEPNAGTQARIFIAKQALYRAAVTPLPPQELSGVEIAIRDASRKAETEMRRKL